MIKDRICTVCGSADITDLYPGEVQDVHQIVFDYTFSPENNKTLPVVLCRSCSHQFCWPVPPDIYKHYEDVADTKYMTSTHHRRATASAVLDLIASYVPSGRLLDVGCATGDFLFSARARGYDVEGIELSAWSCKIAQGNGLQVHQELLEDFAAGRAEQFDIVTLFGVIEHFVHPAEAMKHLHRLLKPDGLLVLWTGDVESITSRLLGRKWWYWQGQHIQFFSHRSLKKLVELNGFSYVTTTLYPYAATYENIANSIQRYSAHRLLMTVLKPFFAIKPVWYWHIPGEMLFFARRISNPASAEVVAGVPSASRYSV